jgi:hypothetical protein
MDTSEYLADQERDYESGKNETRYCKLQKVEEHLNQNKKINGNRKTYNYGQSEVDTFAGDLEPLCEPENPEQPGKGIAADIQDHPWRKRKQHADNSGVQGATGV